jgi:hypothetical protein
MLQFLQTGWTGVLTDDSNPGIIWAYATDLFTSITYRAIDGGPYSQHFILFVLYEFVQ